MAIATLNALREVTDATSTRNSRATFENLGIVARYDRGESVYRRNDPIEHCYRVIRGAARKCAVTADGRRYIIDFILPGDLFGLGESGFRPFNVEAIVAGTLVARYPRVSVERLIDSEPEFARRVRESAFDSMFRMQQRVVILGRSAVERVSTFLLELSDRRDRGQSRVVYLPMSRYDIADYLAIAGDREPRSDGAQNSPHHLIRRCARGAHPGS